MTTLTPARMLQREEGGGSAVWRERAADARDGQEVVDGRELCFLATVCDEGEGCRLGIGGGHVAGKGWRVEGRSERAELEPK